ncbi:unnamed protein product [Polarella glacialis]|uniref:Polyketide synthase dehydratase domain-containing protein n=1 Tax=Polarella glacialis TaxID=89957 RepID=A0A813EZB2_POLGL|nr:unnamed protein product [Polarella glacialis]CAE8639647.1 unnamed protein product [Polarella glacialis]CAE8648249.1 unnamed protein product [Polarella glacialis]
MAEAALSSAQAKMAEARGLLPAEDKESPETLVGFEARTQQLPGGFEKRQLFKSQASEALSLAKEALVSFRRAGESEKKVAALRVVVDANMAIENSFDALMAASDELAMIKRADDKKAQVAVTQMLAEVQAARNDFGSAMQSATDALDLQRQLGNKAGQAQALQTQASLKLSAGKGKDAVTIATQALGLYQELRDVAGEAACKRIVNRGYAESGQLEKAPNRTEAVQALQALASAVENKDKRAWQAAIGQLNKSSAYTQQDVHEIFGEALKKDRKAAAAFLQEQGVKGHGSAPELIIKEVTKIYSYVGFRLGGLGYGPRFRCLNPTHGLMVKGDPNSMHAVACLKISDEADDWEKDLQYHPGILDGVLQSQSALA